MSTNYEHDPIRGMDDQKYNLIAGDLDIFGCDCDCDIEDMVMGIINASPDTPQAWRDMAQAL